MIRASCAGMGTISLGQPTQGLEGVFVAQDLRLRGGPRPLEPLDISGRAHKEEPLQRTRGSHPRRYALVSWGLRDTQ
jgi:hypothetical protein